MVNLIPEEYKESIKREYRLRFVAVVSLFIFFAIGISVVALLPGAFSVGADYFLIRKIQPQEVSSEDEEKIKEFNTALQSFRETLSVLDPKKEDTPVLFSELIKMVDLQKPEGVSVSSFSFVSESSSVKKLLLSGVARNRESLVSFSKRLGENETFSQTSLPISNLSKKEDIEFSITLTVKQEDKEEEVKP